MKKVSKKADSHQKSATASKKSLSPAEKTEVVDSKDFPAIPHKGIRVSYALKIDSSEGEIFLVEDDFLLPYALSDAMVSYAPEQFRQLLDLSLVQPAQIQLSDWLEKKYKPVEPVDEVDTFLPEDPPLEPPTLEP